MNKIEFGEWIRQQRTTRSWSQSDLARESGLYRSLINNIENGVSEPTPKTLTALAKALKVEAQYLFELMELLPQKAELSPIKRKLVHVAEELPDSDVETAIALLEQRLDYYKKHPKARPAQ
jgi:transcriptional regulator with XRE-family HTH domain